MKLIRTVDAAGQVLCHDITQIIPGEFKGPRFRKGHIVQPEDIPVLLSIGKENLYVWEKRPGILHEDVAAALLYKAAAGKNIHGTEPKEGKIALIADCDGLLKINREALLAVNRTPQMMIATIHGDLPVKKGQKLAGTRIIPLVIEQEKITRQSDFAFLPSSENKDCKGYEIHMGRTTLLGDAPEQPVARLEDGRTDGYYLNNRCWGSYMHGILDNPAVLDNLAEGFDTETPTGTFDYAAFKEEQYDKLAALVREHVDMEYIYNSIKN